MDRPNVEIPFHCAARLRWICPAHATGATLLSKFDFLARSGARGIAILVTRYSCRRGLWGPFSDYQTYRV